MSFMSKLLAIFLLVSPVLVKAHEARPGLLTLKQQSELSYGAEFKQPQVQGRFLNLAFQTNCDSQLKNTVTSSTAMQETFQLTCKEPLKFVEVTGLKGTLVDTMVTITDSRGDKKNFLVTSREPRIDTANGTTISGYFILGVEHLMFGLDHVLFVLLLSFMVKGWQNLLKVITSFTIAHSITLGLSAFKVVTLPQGPIEALIALSIILLASEVLRPNGSLIRQGPWFVAFLFGLLHGLGFAGALSAIGLPTSSAVSAILLFNVGLEIGQILVILTALALVYIAGRFRVPLQHRAFLMPVYLIGGLATYWFIERSLVILM